MEIFGPPVEPSTEALRLHLSHKLGITLVSLAHDPDWREVVRRFLLTGAVAQDRLSPEWHGTQIEKKGNVQWSSTETS